MSGVGTANPFALLQTGSEAKSDNKVADNSSKGGKGANRGTRGPKREFDRRSGTGRGKEVHKKGHGKGGWGKYGEEYGVPADDGSRPNRGRRGRGRGRRGRGRGRGGRGKGGRGGRGRGKAPAPADGEAPPAAEGEEGKTAEEGKAEELDEDLFPEEEEEVEEDPDNFTLEEYKAKLELDNEVLKPREVADEGSFKTGKLVRPKKVEEDTEFKSAGKKKKKKGKQKKKADKGKKEEKEVQRELPAEGLPEPIEAMLGREVNRSREKLLRYQQIFREQLGRLEDMLLKIPEAVYSNIKENTLSNVTEQEAQIMSRFSQKCAQFDKSRENHKIKMKPSLATRETKKLDDLESRETSRVRKACEFIKVMRGRVVTVEKSNLSTFVAHTVNSHHLMVQIFDSLVHPSDTVPDAARPPARRTLKHLLRHQARLQKSGGDGNEEQKGQGVPRKLLSLTYPGLKFDHIEVLEQIHQTVVKDDKEADGIIRGAPSPCSSLYNQHHHIIITPNFIRIIIILIIIITVTIIVVVFDVITGIVTGIITVIILHPTLLYSHQDHKSNLSIHGTHQPPS
mmetsp:Transcript_21485/g.43109  ORF Transcript_21485/g.43109 Transcript_21485/m.43109 type:complete len:566 (-) Transcript_21485:339-2036(-)